MPDFLLRVGIKWRLPCSLFKGQQGQQGLVCCDLPFLLHSDLSFIQVGASVLQSTPSPASAHVQGRGVGSASGQPT